MKVMKINENLKNKRMQLGLTQKQVGKEIKVGQSTICHFEQGRKTMNTELIIHKLINFYNEYEQKQEKAKLGGKNKTISQVRVRAKVEPKENNNFSVKLQKIYNEELAKLNKGIEQKALRRALRRALKEF